MHTTTEGDMPLLWLARTFCWRARLWSRTLYQASRGALRSAADDLGRYERMYPDAHPAQAAATRREIEAYEHDIHHHHDGAADRISALLKPIDEWNQAGIKLKRVPKMP